MCETAFKVVPKARFVFLDTPPVVGAVVLELEAGGVQARKSIRHRL